ncbi:RimK family alpha-L-glutamate ligase [Amycolatopsis sp. NPDC088138]|uniref:ATP-grasp domain-containing protein n=1 Tax=Amycolatopsis sp. NPDC088138 TaxID=3363938 RepID=UPI0038172485
MVRTNVVLYWLRPDRGANDEEAGFFREAAAACGIDLRVARTGDVVLSHDGKTTEVRVDGEVVSPSTAFFHTKWPGAPSDPAGEWRHLTTTAALEAAGFLVTVPALHTMVYGDRTGTGLRADWHGIPSVPSVRVCTREIGNHPARFEPGAWGLDFPLSVRAAAWHGPEFTVDDAEGLRAVFQMAGAAELTLSISAATGADVRRVFCVGGEPYGCLPAEGALRPVPDALLASARGVAGELGLACVTLEYHEKDGRHLLAAVEADQDDELRIPALAQARFGAYRRLFDEFVTGAGTGSWSYRPQPGGVPIGTRGDAVMYWIRTDRESKTPNPAHDVADQRFELAGERAGTRIRPVAVDDVVVGRTGDVPQVLVHGQRVDPAEAFFHTKLMSWPENEPDLARHLATYCVLEAAGFFTTVPAMHSVINNDKLLSAVLCPGGIASIATTSVHTRPGAAVVFDAPIEFPVIVKPAGWGAGNSVFALRNRADLNPVLRLAGAAGLTVVIQPWLGTGVADCRVYCVDGEPRGAVLRRPRGDSVTSNFGQGGRAEAVEVPAELAGPAREVALTLGLPYVCVDFLHGADGWWFSEIEADGDTLPSSADLTDLRFGSYRLAFDRFAAGAPSGWLFGRTSTDARLSLRGPAPERAL